MTPLSSSDLDRLKEFAKAATLGKREVHYHLITEPSLCFLSGFEGSDCRAVDLFEGADSDLIAACDRETILALVGEVRGWRTRATEPRAILTGLVETTLTVPEHPEPGLIIAVNRHRYIREDEVQRTFRSMILGSPTPAEPVRGREPRPPYVEVVDFTYGERATLHVLRNERGEVDATERVPIVGRAEPAPPVEGRVSFAIERIVPAADRYGISGKAPTLAFHVEEMASELAGSLTEEELAERPYRIRVSIEPEDR